MRKRDRHQPDAPESEPPTPEPQGDGSPSPADVQDAAPADREASDDAEGQGGEAEDRARGDGSDPSRSDVSQQLSDQRDKYLRLAAEYDNYRKRTAKERTESWSRAQAELVSRLLDALDDLQRFAHIDPAATDAQTLHKGIEMVEKKALKALGSTGLEVINPVDQSFDPNLHEAVATEPALSSEDDHTVARVLQPGYLFNGQLLRPARVIVKQWRA